MHAKITTTLNCTVSQFWEEVAKPQTLQFVSWPLVSFVKVDGQEFGERWEIGRVYHLKIYFMGFLPLGRHNIEIVKMDRDSNLIVTNEGGRLVKVWNHTLDIKELEPGLIEYSDEIEIDAGWLTIPIWLHANIF